MRTSAEAPEVITCEAPVARPRTLGRWRLLAVLVAIWALANGLTHIVLWAAAGKIYYQLAPPAALACEASIGALNFLLPLLMMKFYFHDGSLRAASGWRWTGWQTLGWALGGFLALFGAFDILNFIFHNQIISYAPSAARPYTGAELRALVLMLLVFPAAGEEMMFRGFLQTKLADRFGAAVGIILPALLFGVRHHPSDLYFATIHHASAAAWGNRLLQLYACGLILGLVRHRTRSTWSSWMVHMLILAAIISFGGMWKYLFG